MKRTNETRQDETRRSCSLQSGYIGRGIAILLLACLACGCSTFDLKRKIPWLDENAEVKHPTKIIVMWTNTVLNEPGRKGVRGFGARVMFQGKDHDKPVRVNGSLTVFAFDVTTRASSTPDRKFVFTAEQFAEHYSYSKLGHSYSVWLPWDEVGGEPRRVSLVVRFEPAEGSGTILSDDSIQILPGITRDVDEGAPNELTRKKSSRAIQQASYEEPEESLPSWRQDKRTTLTNSDPIELPPSFTRRIGTQAYADELEGSDPKTSVERSADSARESKRTGSKPKQSRATTEHDQSSNGAVSPYEQLMERQKELSDRFGRQRLQARKASSARSKPVVPPKELVPRDERSRPLPSASREPKDPFDSDDSTDSANSQ